MRQTQRGITLLGWMLLLIPIVIIAYAAIRVTPIYLNYFRVVKAHEQTAAEGGGRVGAHAASFANRGSYSSGTVQPAYTPESSRIPGPDGWLRYAIFPGDGRKWFSGSSA